MSGVALYSGGSEPHNTNSREEFGLWCDEAEWGGGRGRKLGRVSVCYEWSCEGGMEGRVCRYLGR